MAAPTFQAAGTFQSGGAVQLTVPWPAHAVNDIGILVIESGAAIAALATAAGFVEIPQSPQSTAGLVGGVYWCRATSTSMASVVTGTGSNHITAVIVTARGCITTGDPWDVTSDSAKTVASTVTAITGDTTTLAECLIQYIAARGSDQAANQYSGEVDITVTNLTERVDNGTITGNGGGIGYWTADKATAGAYGPMAATLANTSPEFYWSIALKPASTAVTGTVAVTEEADTPAISGTVANPVTGTIGATEGADTSTIAAVQTLSGTLTSAEGDDTSTITGAVANPITGTIAYTEEDDTPTISGDSTSPAVTGNISNTEGDDTSNFAGTVVPPAVTGTITATEDDDTSTISGNSTVPGTMVTTEQDDTPAFSGIVANPVTGTSTAAEGDDTGAFVGLISNPGTLTATEGDDSANFVGVVANPITGTFDGVETADVGLFVGTVTGGVVVGLTSLSAVSSWSASSTVTSWLVESDVQ